MKIYNIGKKPVIIGYTKNRYPIVIQPGKPFEANEKTGKLPENKFLVTEKEYKEMFKKKTKTESK